jgi:hypothetical protein
MKRFWLLLASEFRLARMAIPIHLVAFLQPVVMYLLMTAVLVDPTFDVNMARPTTQAGEALLAAMRQVGSPIGKAYINPILVEEAEPSGVRQVISVEEYGGQITAVQRYGLIDSNMVKNYRNRLTAASLLLWEDDLGSRAVAIHERPWLEQDRSYDIYFGLAMLPLSAFMTAVLVGAITTAGDFESGVILEYRLTPISARMVLGARLLRLTLTALAAAGLMLAAIWGVTGAAPGSLALTAAVLTPVAVVAGCLGVAAGLMMQSTIPAFIIGLVATFSGWILGGAFGLPAGFGGGYELVSRFMPHTYAIEVLFGEFYGIEAAARLPAVLILGGYAVLMMAVTLLVYRQRVSRQV